MYLLLILKSKWIYHNQGFWKRKNTEPFHNHWSQHPTSLTILQNILSRLCALSLNSMVLKLERSLSYRQEGTPRLQQTMVSSFEPWPRPHKMGELHALGALSQSLFLLPPPLGLFPLCHVLLLPIGEISAQSGRGMWYCAERKTWKSGIEKEWFCWRP